MKAKAFYMMYLTLMLILVSFLVGSFVRKAIGQKQPKIASETKQKQIELAQQIERPVDSFTLHDVFLNDTDLDFDKIEALATMLNQHDIRAEISVYPAENEERVSAFENALGRSVTVLGQLYRRGVKAEFVRGIASTSKAGNIIEVRIFNVA